jgi:hypothetical protein
MYTTYDTVHFFSTISNIIYQEDMCSQIKMNSDYCTITYFHLCSIFAILARVYDHENQTREYENKRVGRSCPKKEGTKGWVSK